VYLPGEHPDSDWSIEVILELGITVGMVGLLLKRCIALE
jgi:hypothetical protein